MTGSVSNIPALEIRLFGEMTVTMDGVALPPLRSKKGLWLLALLVLWSDTEITRTNLAATLWPESLEEQALSSLRRTLTDLRHALGEYQDRILAPTPRTIKLDRDLTHTDVWTFDRLVRSAKIENIEMAVALYRGSLLAPCLEEWVLKERARYEENYLKARQTLARRAFDQQDYATCITHLKEIVATSPLQEEAQRMLLKALAATGDYATMTLTYRTLRLYFHEHLQADPDPETTALYHQLRSKAREAARSTSRGEKQEISGFPATSRSVDRAPLAEHNLSRPLARLIGREQEMKTLFTNVSNSRLITLTGIGGVGKTRLAIELGWLALQNFTDGVWFLDLTVLNSSALIPEGLASLLNIRQQPGERLEMTLIGRLTGKKMLIVFDNCEHLNAGCASLVQVLLGQCPDLHVLATSRQPLGLPGEQIQILTPLAVPAPHNMEELASSVGSLETYLQNEALRLFVERCSAVVPSFRLTPQNLFDAVDICRHLDGIPLALELAAARVKVLTVSQIAIRLKDRFRLLADQSRHSAPRQRTLQALIDWSYDLLSPEERALLRRLSVFVGSWTLEAAEEVCPGNIINRDDILPHLAELIDKSLVSVAYEHESETRNSPDSETDETDGADEADETDKESQARRYRMLETVRQYGKERLEEANETETYTSHHSAYFLKFAIEMRPYLSSVKAHWALHRLEMEHDNLRTALQNLRDPIEKLQLAEALSGFWHEHGYYREGRAWLEASLSALPSNVDPVLVGRSLYGVGILARSQGDSPASKAAHKECFARYRMMGDASGQALALNNLGIHAMAEGDSETAYRFYEEGLALAASVNDLGTLARLYNNMGRTKLNEGKLLEAKGFLQEARRVGAMQTDNRPVIAATGNLAEVCFVEHDYGAARKLWEECLLFDSERDFKWGIASTHGHLGRLELASGNLETSQLHFGEALRRSLKIADKTLIAFGLEGFASIALLEGKTQRAVVLLAGSHRIRTNFSLKAFHQQQQQIDMDIRTARNLLGPDLFDLQWHSGATMEMAPLIQLALSALNSDGAESMIQ